LEEKIGFPAIVPPEPLITGALGAALIAGKEIEKISADELKQRAKERHLEAVTFFDDESNRGRT
jgi:hypothetical protein